MTTTPADELRTAAIAIRCKANAAAPGPWRADDSEIYSQHIGGDWVAETLNSDSHAVTAANGEHIASWHPTVALAVADWLDSHARDLAGSGSLTSCDSPGDVQHALAVARAYLGTTQQVTA